MDERALAAMTVDEAGRLGYELGILLDDNPPLPVILNRINKLVLPR